MVCPPISSWPHLRCDVGLEEGEYKWKLYLCYSTVYYYNGAQWYEQFLQVGWLYRALILLGLDLCLPSAFVSSVLMLLYRYWNFFCLHPSLYLLVSWAWWDWPLTWLTNCRPSVLWHWWLGHVTRKTVSKMTYNVSSGTLNSTIPYHTIFNGLILKILRTNVEICVIQKIKTNLLFTAAISVGVTVIASKEILC